MHHCGMTAYSTSLKEIGARLVLLRHVLGKVSQAAFAARIDVSPQALSNYEKGFRRPDIDVALRICQRTGVTLDWIYQGNVAGLPLALHGKLSDDLPRGESSGA